MMCILTKMCFFRQSLVEDNKGEFFQNSLFKEVNEHVERLIEKQMSKRSITRDQATKETRFAILCDEHDEKGILQSIVNVFRTVFKNTSRFSELCSVM